MAAWIISALRLLGAGAAGAGIGGGLARSGGSGGLELLEDNPLIPNIIERFLPGERFVGGDPRGRRRRRRRALTASDRADIAFIAGMISKAAAKDFAVQLAARPR